MSVYSTGVLHPEREIGVSYYQGVLRQACLSHLAEEKKLGRRIHPATPLSQREEELDYSCGAGSDACGGEALAW
jgi:hypothetical protein